MVNLADASTALGYVVTGAIAFGTVGVTLFSALIAYIFKDMKATMRENGHKLDGALDDLSDLKTSHKTMRSENATHLRWSKREVHRIDTELAALAGRELPRRDRPEDDEDGLI